MRMSLLSFWLFTMIGSGMAIPAEGTSERSTKTDEANEITYDIEAYAEQMNQYIQEKMDERNDPNDTYDYDDFPPYSEVLKKWEMFRPQDLEEPNFYGGLGYIYMKQREYGDARAALTRAIEIDPNFIMARTMLATIHINFKEYESAITLLKQTLQIDPENSRAIYNLGWALWWKKDYGECKKYFQEAVAKFPHQIGYHYWLCRSYIRSGEKENAAREYNIVKQMNPHQAHDLYIAYRRTFGPKPKLETETHLYYFADPNHYAGHQVLQPALHYDPNEYIKNIPKIMTERLLWPAKHRIFWKLHGNIGFWNLPELDIDEYYHAERPIELTYDNETQEIFVVSFRGIYGIDPQRKTRRWIWKGGDNIFIRYSADCTVYMITATSNPWFVFSKSVWNTKQRFLVFLNQKTGQTYSQRLPDSYGIKGYARFVIFRDENQAILQIKDDMYRLQFQTDGNYRLDRYEGILAGKYLEGNFDDGPVLTYKEDYETNEGIFRLECGPYKYQFENTIPGIFAFENHRIWITLHPDGFSEIYQIRRNGQKVLWDTFRGRIMGNGRWSGGFWVATKDGVVRRYGEKIQKYQIKIPEM